MKIRVGLGLAEFPFSGPDPFWRWVRLCEEGGVDSLWQNDRLSSAAPFLECMSLMAALAGATRRLKFGMNVLALGLREPLVVAKACATVDYLSNGRFLPAFGVGSPRSPDWAATGRAFKGQGARTDEALDVIARLWRGESVDHEGPHFRLQGARIAPLPIQQPLPMWLGGSSPASIRRTARFGTGWQTGAESPAEAAPIVAAIKAAAEAEGRPMDPEHFGAAFYYRFGSSEELVVEARRTALRQAFPGLDPDRVLVVGGAGDILRRIAAYEAAGVSKFILRPLAQGDDDHFVQTRLLIEEVLPQAHGRKVAA